MAKFDDLMSLCLRRGFLMPSAEIYGGLGGFYDYGHNGAKMRRRWEDQWIRYFLGLGENYHLIDTTTVLPFEALKASGHVDLFTDVLIRCSKCGESYRAEALLDPLGVSADGLLPQQVDEVVSGRGVRCPRCGGRLEPAHAFHLMFPVGIGPKGEDQAFLRPETAQGVYLNFKREFDALRKRLPLGLAIVGRAYRNEISPRQGLYRLREFLQAELQIFFDPEAFDRQIPFEAVAGQPLIVLLEAERAGDAAREMAAGELLREHAVPAWYAYHMVRVQEFYLTTLGIRREAFRFYEVGRSERAHYNRIQFDVQLNIESFGGFREVAGVHYRTDHDLKGHGLRSKEKMEVFVEGRRFIPHVLELSFGVDRNIWGLLDAAYTVADGRSLLSLPPRFAPVALGVFPLVNKDGLPEVARELYSSLRASLDVVYDEAGSIGRRYARQDEIGTPLCATVDHDSLEGRDVTLRDRDSTRQVRVSMEGLAGLVAGLIHGDQRFEDLESQGG